VSGMLESEHRFMHFNTMNCVCHTGHIGVVRLRQLADTIHMCKQVLFRVPATLYLAIMHLTCFNNWPYRQCCTRH